MVDSRTTKLTDLIESAILSLCFGLRRIRIELALVDPKRMPPLCGCIPMRMVAVDAHLFYSILACVSNAVYDHMPSSLSMNLNSNPKLVGIRRHLELFDKDEGMHLKTILMVCI